ncbi:uncharacterized protein LOC121385352 [Gigantopelta aegis]|uniref:uncharacterized protein LOC121385352 n=1 Tax=Gigantopelta aegis TaxID=1735272 RepID=UPI001B88E760|nr:uncharacterized protein LOC121385352 [Gigantopelta aegis]
MPGNRCIVAGCDNTYKSGSISLHILPRDEETRGFWKHFVQKTRPDLTNFKKSHSLCSAHFKDDCFDHLTFRLRAEFGMTSKTTLKPYSVPTIYPKMKKETMFSDISNIKKTKRTLSDNLKTMNFIMSMKAKRISTDRSRRRPASNVGQEQKPKTPVLTDHTYAISTHQNNPDEKGDNSCLKQGIIDGSPSNKCARHTAPVTEYPHLVGAGLEEFVENPLSSSLHEIPEDLITNGLILELMSFYRDCTTMLAWLQVLMGKAFPSQLTETCLWKKCFRVKRKVMRLKDGIYYLGDYFSAADYENERFQCRKAPCPTEVSVRMWLPP